MPIKMRWQQPHLQAPVGVGRRPSQGGNEMAGPRNLELPPVVGAAQGGIGARAGHRARRETGAAVRAAVEEGGQAAVQADQDPRLPEEQHPERLDPDLAGQRHRVPPRSQGGATVIDALHP